MGNAQALPRHKAPVRAQAVVKTVTSQAGVMAARAITDTAKFDIVRQQKPRY